MGMWLHYTLLGACLFFTLYILEVISYQHTKIFLSPFIAIWHSTGQLDPLLMTFGLVQSFSFGAGYHAYPGTYTLFLTHTRISVA